MEADSQCGSCAYNAHRRDARDLDDVGFLRPVRSRCHGKPAFAAVAAAAAGAVPAVAAAPTGAGAPEYGGGDEGRVSIDRYQCGACAAVLSVAEVDRIGACVQAYIRTSMFHNACSLTLDRLAYMQ